MHQNAVCGRATHGPAGEAYNTPEAPRWIKREGREGGGKGQERREWKELREDGGGAREVGKGS